MENRTVIEADTRFVRDIMDMGGESLKKCFQCGTCSTVCSLSPSERPFPRKEMIWAQWGLKDRLLKDPDIWLCHQCNDCSANCPRGARPGDVLAAIRGYAIGHFSRPRFLAKALSTPKYLAAVLIVPAVLLLGFFWAVTGFAFPAGEISPEAMIPDIYTYMAMGALFVFMFVVAGMGIYSFWKAISESGQNQDQSPMRRSGWSSIVSVVTDIVTHSKFDKCGKNELSRYSHLAMFYGAVLLLIATGLSAVLNHFFGIFSPHPLYGPVKIAGNVGALGLTAGLGIVIYRRLSSSDNPGNTGYFDWFLVWILFFTAISGVATEVIRLAGLATATYSVYLVHLWLMFVFFLYLPFSKAAHMVYRTVALAYARQVGRGET